MSVNCQHYDAGRCAAGHHGGEPPLVACRLCQHRQAVDPTQPAVMRVKGKPFDEASAPVPRERWPAWASWLADRRAVGDQGVGDTIERLLGEGGKGFKLLWSATFEKIGLGCGCDRRRERWNAMFAYKPA